MKFEFTTSCCWYSSPLSLLIICRVTFGRTAVLKYHMVMLIVLVNTSHYASHWYLWLWTWSINEICFLIISPLFLLYHFIIHFWGSIGSATFLRLFRSFNFLGMECNKLLLLLLFIQVWESTSLKVLGFNKLMWITCFFIRVTILS